MKSLVTTAAAVIVGLFPVVNSVEPQDYFSEALDRSPYLAWLSGQSTSYDRHYFLAKASNANEGVAVFWKIHGGENGTEELGSEVSRTTGNSKPWIQFAIAVQASEWVGFGLSEAGGMLGADMAIFDASNPNEVRDAHVIEERYPQTDDCQHWDLLNSTIDDEWLIFEIARDLDTGDSQDRVIVDDSNPYTAGCRLIAAWGSNPFGYHGENVARSTVKLFAKEQALVSADIDDRASRFEDMSDGSMEVRENNFTIPTRETTYHNVCFKYDDLLEQSGLEDGQSATLIGAVPVITAETKKFVHHFVVYSSREPMECEYGSVMMAWAPGETGLELPANVGFPIFGEGQAKSIMVEIHYNNPSGIADQLDSSGVRFFFTLELREFEAGYLELGDPLLQLSGEKIGEGLTEWSFDCASSCSDYVLGGESVTVIMESLHMHKTGARMVNEVIRGEQVVHTGAVDVFDFNQQGSFRVPMKSYEVMPGDSFRTTCYYRDGTEFGISSQEEMCIAFLLYYPVKRVSVGQYIVPWACAYGIPYPLCSEELSSRTLSREEDLDRVFGSSYGSCEVAKHGDDGNKDDPLDTDGDTGDDGAIIDAEGSNAFTPRGVGSAFLVALISMVMLSNGVAVFL